MVMKPVNAPTLPKPIAKLIAGVLNKALWWPTISPDEVERKYIDDIGVEAYLAKATSEGEGAPSGWEVASGVREGSLGVDGEAVKGWKELDITPDLVEEHAIKYLRRYRSS